MQVPLEKPGPALTEPGDAWEPEAMPTHPLGLRPHLRFVTLSGPVPRALLFSWWQVAERTTWACDGPSPATTRIFLSARKEEVRGPRDPRGWCVLRS